MSPRERLEQAAIAYADADTDLGFKRASDLLRKHALSYAYHLVDQAQNSDRERVSEKVSSAAES